ncbi:alpha/beta fold hydrolase [Desulfonema magnum]|uniref:alpha/beta fold hydrolase n=1 Tax=Desulfonema magnum TaxID=45655 RepID=UPI001A9BC9EC
MNAFVSALNLSNVTLAGHSLGGAIVQCLALRSPEWLTRIILVGTGARLRVAPAILDGLSCDPLPSVSDTSFKSAINIICDYAFGPSASPSLIQAAIEDFLKNRPEVFHGDYLACDQFDIMENIGQIRFPTLIISGAADTLTPVKYSEYLYTHIPEAEMSVIEEGGHMMGLEKPEEFTEKIKSFLFRNLQQ